MTNKIELSKKIDYLKQLIESLEKVVSGETTNPAQLNSLSIFSGFVHNDIKKILLKIGKETGE